MIQNRPFAIDGLILAFDHKQIIEDYIKLLG